MDVFDHGQRFLLNDVYLIDVGWEINDNLLRVKIGRQTYNSLRGVSIER